MRILHRSAALAALLTVTLASRGDAQLPNPSAGFLAVGENYTALARGSDAVSLNPAGLAMPDGPSLSASILALRGVGGIGPISLGDLAQFDGRTVPDDVRMQWLERITKAGREEGSAGAELTYVAAQLGRFGLQVGSSAHVVGDLGPGAAELLLFGNAGRTGEPVDLEFDGTAFNVAVTTTAAFGYAHPLIRDPGRSLSIGGTLKYTVGHLMLTALDQGGAATVSPLEVRVELPIVQTNTESGSGGRGSGVGLDLGMALREGGFYAGLVVRNAFNTFAWDEDNLQFRAGALTVNGETRATDFDTQEFDAAPAPVRARVDDLVFAPEIAGGVAYELAPGLMLSADGRQRIGDGHPFEPASHLGVGAEIRPLPWLPLRGGAAIESDGFLISGGAGARVGPVRLDGAAARRTTDFGAAVLLMATFSLVTN